MKKISLFLFLLIINLVFVSAVPELPMLITGEVYINNHPARAGTEISAMINGNEVAKTEISDAGKFTLLLQKLNEGDEIKLYVDGIDTKESILYKSGDFKQLTLKVEKSYVIYYAGGTALALLALAGVITWRKKRKR